MERTKVTSARGRGAGGRQPVGGQPGVHARRLGLADTVEKVRKAAAELGYRPNVLARAMVSGKSRIIGVVVAYLDNQFYPDALEKLSNALQARNYHVLIFMAATDSGDADAWWKRCWTTRSTGSSPPQCRLVVRLAVAPGRRDSGCAVQSRAG